MVIDTNVWIAFIAFIILLLVFDLGVFHRKSHEVKIKEALIWSAVWISLALIFNYGIYYFMGKEKAFEFLTGYLIEKSLSIDNLFVFIMLFTFFDVKPKYQHKVLFWGILGALVLRAIFIFAGVALISKFHWIIYVFGAFLIITAYRMLTHKSEDFNPKKSKLFSLIKKIYPVTYMMDGDKFFIKKRGIKAATPLFVALVIIELTDLFFAIDSIPAILAISADPFIVFSSNILAVMGLRSMYFLISGMLNKFRYINYSLVVILAFVGVKMILSHHVEFPEWVSLGVIVASLTGGIMASLLIPEKKELSA